MKHKDKLTRRDFLKYSAMALGGLAFSRRGAAFQAINTDDIILDDPLTPVFPENTPLGRVCVGGPGTPVSIKSEPYMSAPTVRRAWFDEVFLWKKQVVTRSDQINFNVLNQRWVETPEGYIFADVLQPVKHVKHSPLAEFPETAVGARGMWVEITTPFAPMDLIKPKEEHQHWIRDVNNIYPRVHYSQVFWAFDIRTHPERGVPQYCLKQGPGSLPDVYWVDAEICSPITP
ncbi:MAG: twin-arginine translocation signal domain-containing protein, partial [Brevefilum sp.]